MLSNSINNDQEMHSNTNNLSFNKISEEMIENDSCHSNSNNINIIDNEKPQTKQIINN